VFRKLITRVFLMLLCGLLVFTNLSTSAYAYTAQSAIAQSNGAPIWSQVSFDNMGTVQGSNFGYVDDPALIQAIGYNPSRAFSPGDLVSTTLKIGDLDIFGLGSKTVGDFLGGANPNNVSLGTFKAVNGLSLNDLIASDPALGKMPINSIPLVQSILSGNRSGIANNIFPFLQQVSPDVKQYLQANPWAKDLPVEQLLQGDWQGVALQGALKVGLPKLIQQFPSLKQIPIGDILTAAQSGNPKALVTFGAQTLLDKFAKDNPALANLPIGTLTNINNLSISAIPNLANTALTSIPGLKNQIIKNVPGLANVPLDSLLGLIKSAVAKIDFPDAGAQSATRAMTGGGYSFASTPCATGVCPNFEVNDAKALLFSNQLNGLQFVVGSLDSKKGQSVKGGKGPLAAMFGGKESVHIRPWGDGPNVAMAATNVDDVKGTASFAFYIRVCADLPLVGRTCSPYGIGPIPFTTIHEGETVVIQSAGQPPINAAAYAPAFGTAGGCGSSGNAAPAPSSSPNAPISQQNLKRYLDRIALGESSGGLNLGPNYLGAYGKYAFIPATRASILSKYGYDGWEPAQWDNASIALIKDVGGQKTLDLIAQGNFGYADTVLNGTWSSLPGGREQSPAWSNPTTLAAYGAVSVVGALPNSQQQPATLVASTSASLCGNPTPCPPGQTTCTLKNPLAMGIIPGPGGLYGAPRPGRIHLGVDLQSPTGYANAYKPVVYGDPVIAEADGEVEQVIPVGRCGGIVMLRLPGHNIETRHLHMISTAVQYNQAVKRGQQIGTESDQTSACGVTGPHLHLEVYSPIGGGTINPTTLQYDPPMPTHP
jgi:murein DD-endopeptidase MepM/ murein hydrolase activator NlpD